MRRMRMGACDHTAASYGIIATSRVLSFARINHPVFVCALPLFVHQHTRNMVGTYIFLHNSRDRVARN